MRLPHRLSLQPDKLKELVLRLPARAMAIDLRVGVVPDSEEGDMDLVSATACFSAGPLTGLYGAAECRVNQDLSPYLNFYLGDTLANVVEAALRSLIDGALVELNERKKRENKEREDKETLT